MKKLVHDFTVLKKTDLNKDLFVLILKAKNELPDIKAGQFVNVKIENSPSTFLRRPLSIYFVDYKENTLHLFVKKLGVGTRKLSEINEGDNLNLVYPLGSAFSIPKESNTLLIGGGVGIAPLLFLAKKLKEAGNKVSVIFGARSGADIVELEKYEQYAKVYITTEDGSLGEKAYPTQHSVIEKEKFDMIFTCGPDPMMRAVAKLAQENNIDCEVSLENMMACGIGACLCCVEDTKEGNKNTCIEGPVFNLNKLKW